VAQAGVPGGARLVLDPGVAAVAGIEQLRGQADGGGGGGSEPGELVPSAVNSVGCSPAARAPAAVFSPASQPMNSWLAPAEVTSSLRRHGAGTLAIASSTAIGWFRVDAAPEVQPWVRLLVETALGDDHGLVRPTGCRPPGAGVPGTAAGR
jgi:hypothetical protein